jgi:hypothetical protein
MNRENQHEQDGNCVGRRREHQEVVAHWFRRRSTIRDSRFCNTRHMASLSICLADRILKIFENFKGSLCEMAQFPVG